MRWRLKHLVRTSPTKAEVRSLAPETPVSFVPMEAVGEYGGLDLGQTRPLQDVLGGYTFFRDGDVVVAKITPCFENGKGALAEGLESGIGFGTTELHVLRPGPQIEGRFLFYLTVSDRFRRVGESTMYGAGGQKRISERFVSECRVDLPPLSAQRTVTDFLDRETARVDELIEKKERLLALLDEKRTALITQAATKGLDPDVPMKDSGVEWLGEVPAHWEVVPARRLFREVDRRAGSGDYELLTVSHLTGVTRRSEKTVTMIEAESHDLHKVCRPHEVVVNTMWAWMGGVGVAHERGIVSPSYNVYRPRSDRLSSAFYELIARCPPHVAEMRRLSKGIWRSRLRLYPEAFGEIQLPVPPQAEQRRLVHGVSTRTRPFVSIGDNLQKAITLLGEYRASLIAGTVTGQVDLRDLTE